MKFLNKPFFYKIRYGIITTLVVVVCLFWDLFTKIITDGFDIIVIDGFLWFSSIHNTGAAYGILSGQTTLLIVLSCVMIVLILLYNYFHKNKSIFYTITMGLILGGAIGNLIDRIFLGYVRDFIKFSFFSFTFNLADAFLIVVDVMYVIYLLFFDGLFKSKKRRGGGYDGRS